MTSVTEAKPKYKKIYGKILNETRLESLAEKLPISSFFLVDIDRDGVKNLVVNAFRASAIYTIKKNKAKLLKKWSGGVIVDQVYKRKEKGLALSFSYGTGLLDFEVIGIKKKKVVQKKTGQMQGRDYYIDNKKVPYSSFKNVYDTYFSYS